MCRALHDRTSTYLASLLTPYVPRPSRPDVDVPGLAAHAICAAPFVTGRRRTWPRCSCHMCRALHDRTPTYLASLLTPYVPRRAFRSADRATNGSPPQPGAVRPLFFLACWADPMERATRRPAADRGREHFQSSS